MNPSQRVLSAVAASLLVHGVAAWVLPEPAPVAPAQDASSLLPAEVPFEAFVASTPQLPASLRYPSPPLPGGPMSRSSLDTAESEERGGTGAAPEQGVLLFPFLSSVQLQDSHFNHLSVSQAQRIRTALERSTLEQRRASPHAADAVFLASGAATGHAERRSPARIDARWGSQTGTTASEDGQGRQAPSSAPGASGEQQGLVASEPATGARREQADQGIFRGRGERRSDAARVAFARPDVDRGPAATTSVDEQEQVRDDTDAELLAARLERSLVDASFQRSTRRAPGLGGPEQVGAGVAPTGDGRGAKATPYLPGQGHVGVLDTSDGRYLRWFTNQRARVQEGLVFPHARALAKDQGVSLYQIEVRRDGSLASVPALLRSSGYSDFDVAAVAAIKRAAPFEPLPAALAPEQDQLSLVIPVEFANPMVE